MDNEKIIPAVAVKSSVDTALEAESTDRRKRAGLYRDTTPAKSLSIANIVQGCSAELISSTSAPRCEKNDLECIKRRTAEYVQKRLEEQRLPTVEGWAVALGIGRRTLYDWLGDTSNREVFSYLNLVRDSFSDMHALAAMEGTTNTVSWIFYAKNMFSYTDKTEFVLTPNTSPLGELTDKESLAEKYRSSVVPEYDYRDSQIDTQSLPTS